MNDRRHADEPHLEPNVGAGAGCVLMDFHREGVLSFLEHCGAEVECEYSSTIIAGGGGGGRRRGHNARWHIETTDFCAVQVYDCAVIALDAQDELAEARNVRGGKCLAEIRVRILGVRIRPKRIRGGRRASVGITVAERGRAARPRAIVETWRLPGCPLVRAIVQIFPNRGEGNNNSSHADVHRLRIVSHSSVGLTNGRDPV